MVTIELDSEQYNLLMLMIGYATGTAQKLGEVEMSYSFVELANHINRDKPDWTPYQMPNFKIVKGALDRWVIVSGRHPEQAWSGSAWVYHRKGIGVTVQVANFETEQEARQYAESAKL